MTGPTMYGFMTVTERGDMVHHDPHQRRVVLPYVYYLSRELWESAPVSDRPTAAHDLRLVPIAGESIAAIELAFANDGGEVVWQPIAEWSQGRPKSRTFVEQVFRILYLDAHDADRAYMEIQRLVDSFRVDEPRSQG